MNDIIFRLASTDSELQQCFAIRHSVFVEEQKIFIKTDQDRFDNSALHIVGINITEQKIISTVRCHLTQDNIWYGSRLSVKKEYRNHSNRIGVKLCQFAQKTVTNHDAKRFFAYVQLPNIKFFEGLKWQKVGDPVKYCGLPHQLMEADLFRRTKNSEGFSIGRSESVYV